MRTSKWWFSGFFCGLIFTGLIFVITVFLTDFADSSSKKENSQPSETVEERAYLLFKQGNGSEAKKLLPPGHDLLMIFDRISQGQYAQVKETLIKHNQRLSDVILSEIESTLALTVGFQYQLFQNTPSDILLHDIDQAMSQIKLTRRDGFRIFFSAEESVYIEIFQMDSIGKVNRLFPSYLYDFQNPIQPGVRNQFPADKDWAAPDDLRQPVKETYYVAASRFPFEDIDDAYGNVCRAVKKQEWEKASALLKQRLHSRRDDTIQGTFYYEFSIHLGK